MNENLNLVEILKHCPAGTKFWSSVWGDVFLVRVEERIEGRAFLPIVIKALLCDEVFLFQNGKYTDAEEAECVIFPSKDQRDWSKFKGPKFDPTDLKPFEKVLIKRPDGQWTCNFFSDMSLEPENEKVYCVGMIGYECIPYNEETKHLVGTSHDCPDFYKWWEE
jgi:hypothetical protein